LYICLSVCIGVRTTTSERNDALSFYLDIWRRGSTSRCLKVKFVGQGHESKFQVTV